MKKCSWFCYCTDTSLFYTGKLGHGAMPEQLSRGQRMNLGCLPVSRHILKVPPVRHVTWLNCNLNERGSLTGRRVNPKGCAAMLMSEIHLCRAGL